MSQLSQLYLHAGGCASHVYPFADVHGACPDHLQVHALTYRYVHGVCTDRLFALQVHVALLFILDNILSLQMDSVETGNGLN